MLTYPKRPEEVIRVEFDLREFLAAGEGRTITEYSVLVASGISIPRVTVVGGAVFSVQVAGGLNRWNYEMGLQAIASDGTSFLDVREIQVRGLPLGVGFDGSAIFTSYILDEDGNRLIAENGDLILYS